MGCELSCLKAYSITVGSILMLASVSGLGFCLYLLFGEPLTVATQDTYPPNWEDLGPGFVAAIISLLANLCLIGGAKQYSRQIILFWIVWKFILIAIYWLWFGYNELKFNGYIDWSDQGMRRCYWCEVGLEEYVGFGGALASLFIIILAVPVMSFHGKLNRQHEELTEYELAPIVYDPRNYKY